MRPGVGAAIVGILGVTQIGCAATVSGLIGSYLVGSFPVEGGGGIEVDCALSMKSGSACVAGYVSTTASIILSLVLVAMQCANSEGRVGMGFCGPILSAVGMFWWVAYATSATSAANGAGAWEEPGANLSQYRAAVVAMSWACAALFLVSFFVSAAAAAAASRARTRLADSAAMLRSSSSINKRFIQPAASPPSSPCKSHKSFGSAYEPFDSSDSPKKWVQPHNPRSAHCPVTSDGLRTILLVEGEPVPLSPNLSPAHSPMAGPSPAGSPLAGRSPTHRSLGGGGGSGSVVGSFSRILLPQGSQPL